MKSNFIKLNSLKFLISCVSFGILTPFLYSGDEWQSINEWIPKMVNHPFLSFFLFDQPFLSFQKKFEKDDEMKILDERNIEQTNQTNVEIQKPNLKNFLRIPRVRFFYDSVRLILNKLDKFNMFVFIPAFVFHFLALIQLRNSL